MSNRTQLLYTKGMGPVFGILLMIIAFAHAQESAPLNHVDVQLFGSPCALEGPLDADSLKRIHAISPEQAYPDLEKGGATPAAGLEKSLQKLKSDKPLPSALDRYREKLQSRLSAQAAFLSARAAGTAKLTAVIKKHVEASKRKSVETALQQWTTAPTTEKAAKLDALFEAFNNSIESDPEEDFHRAIRKLGVQYRCNYDGGGAQQKP